MTPDRYRRVRDIVLEVVDRPPAERQAAIRDRCGDDDELVQEVESLLAHEGPDDDVLIQMPRIPTTSIDVDGLEGELDKEAELPDHVGHYDIIEVIGSGSMGTVYRAEQANPKREVALKVIRAGRLSTKTLARFRKEARILATLDHPGIVPVLEADTDSNGNGTRPFFAMPLVSGCPLLEYVERENPDIEERVELLIKICDAVTYAHQRMIIHRDLKPDNILVTDDGQPRILDFGIARIMGGDEPVATVQTHAGEILGTIAYMSPEQSDGAPDGIDARSDAYSLGVIGYQLLCGRLPIDITGLSVGEAIRAVQERPVPRLSSVDPRLRGDLDTIIGKTIEKSKERRYGTVAQLAADLRRHLNREPIAARPPTLGYQMRCFARRHRTPVIVASVAAVLLLATVVVASIGWLDARHAYSLVTTLHEKDVATLIDRLPETALTPVSTATGARLEQLYADAADDPNDVAAIVALADELERRSRRVLRADPGLAFAHRLKTLRLRVRAMRLEPQELAHLSKLSVALVLVGDIYTEQGDRVTPGLCYQKSLAIDEALVELRPGDVHYLDNRFWSYVRMSANADWSGDINLARHYQARLLDEAKRIVAAEPDNPVRYRTLVEAHALEKRYAEDRETAIGHLTEALRAGERAAEIEGAPVSSLEQLFETHWSLATALASGGRLEESEQTLSAAEELLDRIAESNSPEERRMRAAIYRGRARICYMKQRWSESIEWGEATLASDNRRNASRSRMLAQLARACTKLGRDDEARVHAAEAMDLARRVADRPQASVLEVVSYSALLLSPPLPELRDPAAALLVAERAALWSQGVHPSVVKTLAKAQLANDQPAAAVETLHKALGRLAADSRAHRDLQRMLDEIQGQ